MATTVTVFNKVTRNTKTITVDVRASILEGDLDGQMDYFIILSTSARMVNGNSIPDHVITALDDLARGATQQDGVTGTAYSSMTAAIQDHIWHMIDGTASGEEMNFTA
jgi:hypothetical protein